MAFTGSFKTPYYQRQWQSYLESWNKYDPYLDSTDNTDGTIGRNKAIHAVVNKLNNGASYGSLSVSERSMLERNFLKTYNARSMDELEQKGQDRIAKGDEDGSGSDKHGDGAEGEKSFQDWMNEQGFGGGSGFGGGMGGFGGPGGGFGGGAGGYGNVSGYGPPIFPDGNGGFTIGETGGPGGAGGAGGGIPGIDPSLLQEGSGIPGYQPGQGGTGAAGTGANGGVVGGGAGGAGGGAGGAGGGNTPAADDLINQQKNAYQQAVDANEARYQDILTGYQQNKARAIELQEGLGLQEKEDANKQYDRKMASMDQDLIDRGLGNTTVRLAGQRGIEESRADSIGRIDDRLNQQRLNTEIGLEQDLLNFMERRTDSYPDPAQFADLLQNYGASGAGGAVGGGGTGGTGTGGGSGAAGGTTPSYIDANGNYIPTKTTGGTTTPEGYTGGYAKQAIAPNQPNAGSTQPAYDAAKATQFYYQQNGITEQDLKSGKAQQPTPQQVQTYYQQNYSPPTPSTQTQPSTQGTLPSLPNLPEYKPVYNVPDATTQPTQQPGNQTGSQPMQYDKNGNPAGVGMIPGTGYQQPTKHQPISPTTTKSDPYSGNPNPLYQTPDGGYGVATGGWGGGPAMQNPYQVSQPMQTVSPADMQQRYAQQHMGGGTYGGFAPPTLQQQQQAKKQYGSQYPYVNF